MPYDLGRLEAIDVALARPQPDGVLFALDGPQWSFIACGSLEKMAGGIRGVTVEVSTRAGTIGVSLLGDDESDPRSEVILTPGDWHSVDLDVEANFVPVRFLFRSTDAGSRPAAFVVRSVRVHVNAE